MAYTAATEPPAIFNYWVGVSTIAAALQGKVWLDMGLFEWTPHFYTILVGPSGSGKSTAINAGMRLLRNVKGIHIGSDSLTWQSLVDEFTEATAGGTGIRSRGGMRKHSSVTYFLGELGTFLNPHDKKLMSTLTHIWGGDGGEDFKRRTVGRGGRQVEKPFLNLLAGATPAWLADNLPPSLIGTGFTSRCILVLATEKKSLVPYPKRAAQEQGLGDMNEMARLLTDDLSKIAKLQGEYTLSEAAYELGTAWYNQSAKTPPVGLSPDEFGGYLQRRQAHAHKLSLALSAATSDSLVVEASHLEESITVLESIEKAMPAALSGVRDDELRPQLRIEATLKKYGVVSTVELYQRFRSKLDWRSFQSILMSLEAAGLTTEVITPHGKAIRWLGAQQKDSLPS